MVTKISSGTKFFRYRFRYFFPVPNFSDTGSDTFFRYQIFPIPVPRLFSGTNFFRYRFRYHQKNEKFPVPGIPGTGTSHSARKGPECKKCSLTLIFCLVFYEYWLYDIVGLLFAALNVMQRRMIGLTALARAFKSQFGTPLSIIGPLLERKARGGDTLQTKVNLAKYFAITLCSLDQM